jgi:uncharacterized protein (DUF58 family)
MDNSQAALLLPAGLMKKLAALAIAIRRVPRGQIQGERSSARRGHSVEFVDFREYTRGDDMRYVDWKAYGRLGKLFLKLYRAEEDLSLHILIDSSASMRFGEPVSKFHYARQVAAAIGYVGLSEYDRLTVAAFAGDITKRMPSVRTRAGASALFGFLGDLDAPSGVTSFGRAITRYAALNHSPGVAVVLSDYFDSEVAMGLKALLARRYKVTMIQILAPEEKDPQLSGDLRLVDSETGDGAPISLSPYLIGLYKERLASYSLELAVMARRYGMEYIQANTLSSLEDLLFGPLRRHGLLR